MEFTRIPRMTVNTETITEFRMNCAKGTRSKTPR